MPPRTALVVWLASAAVLAGCTTVTQPTATPTNSPTYLCTPEAGAPPSPADPSRLSRQKSATPSTPTPRRSTVASGQRASASNSTRRRRSPPSWRASLRVRFGGISLKWWRQGRGVRSCRGIHSWFG